MRGGDRAAHRFWSALTWVALAACLVWVAAIVGTAVRVQQVRTELARVAADVAHHNAAHRGKGGVAAPDYLTAWLRTGLSARVRSATVQVRRVGGQRVVQVRIEATVGFVFGGHPQIRIAVVRSAPVEEASALP